MIVGADYSHARPTRTMLDKHGIKFVCRYLLDDARNGGKALKRPEALQLSSWGIKICANFEYATRPPLVFAQGATDARVALNELRTMGAPRQVVYFSFDYDVQSTDFAGVLNYLRGAESILGKGNAGAYGHYRLVNYLAAHGIHYLWQCYAWSAGLWSPYALVRQVKNDAFPGEFDGDLDYAMVEDYGQWTLGDDMALTTADAKLIVAQLLSTSLGRADAYDDKVDHGLHESFIGSVNGAQRGARALTKLDAIAARVADIPTEFPTPTTPAEIDYPKLAKAIVDEFYSRNIPPTV